MLDCALFRRYGQTESPSLCEQQQQIGRGRLGGRRSVGLLPLEFASLISVIHHILMGEQHALHVAPA